jgi:anaerobic magnesium-protoporphyrin IX monomethyl ester cyclase
MTIARIVQEVERRRPKMIMCGHAGSTPAHPVTMELFRAIKRRRPEVLTVYGGVYPTYHARQILVDEPSVDFVIRGEGEATAAELAGVLADRPHAAPQDVAGIAFRHGGRPILTPSRPPIRDLDSYAIGWNLIENWDAYRCFGLGRAAIIQLSRGCPHRCTYCGQHEFWVKWRHRSAIKVVDEIEYLRRRYDVRFITFADENPTTHREVWAEFLRELAQRELGVHFFATIRAMDIVRDADLIPLYRRAGILYVLMGIDSTSEEVLRAVRKGSTTPRDINACQLLKDNGIFSVIGHIVGLDDETPATLRAARRRLRFYNGDWLNAMYMTPHDWTPLGKHELDTKSVVADLRKWDYRHQVIAQRHMTPMQIFLRVKWMELWFHLRPGRLVKILFERDQFCRRQKWWVLQHIGMVWLLEIVEFLVTHIRGSNRSLRPQGSDRSREATSNVAVKGTATYVNVGHWEINNDSRRHRPDDRTGTSRTGNTKVTFPKKV